MNIEVPIGGIVAWAKSFSGIPQSLPYGWVECNGQTLSDAQSRFDNQIVPDLNGNGGTKRFLRGSSSSGGVGGTETHVHGSNTDVATGPTVSVAAGVDVNVPSVCHFHGIQTDGTLPSYYEIVYIIRVK